MIEHVPASPRLAARAAVNAPRKTALAAARRAHREEARARRSAEDARMARAEAFAACLELGIGPTAVGRHVNPRKPLNRKTVAQVAALATERTTP